STIDVKTRTKDPTDIPLGLPPGGFVFTPDGKTAFLDNYLSDTVSIIDVTTRTKNPGDITVGPSPFDLALTPDGKTAFVTHNNTRVRPVPGTVSTIDVKTRTKNPDDIAVGSGPLGLAITPVSPVTDTPSSPRSASTHGGKLDAHRTTARRSSAA